MKKLWLFLICLIIAPILFVGCNKEKDDGFVEIQSITYNDITYTSTFSLKHELTITTIDYYLSAELYYDDFYSSGYSKYLNSQRIDTDKSNLNDALSLPLNFVEGKYYHWSDKNYNEIVDDSDDFYEWTIFKKWEVSYYRVRFVDTKTFEIKNPQNELSRISTDYYEIKYFI